MSGTEQQNNPAEPDFGRFAQAWSSVYDRVRLFVASVVWDRHDAEDVTQEVAYKAGRGFASYDPAQPFGAWVMGIAKNEVRHYLRTQSRDRHAFSDDLVAKLADSASEVQPELSARSSALTECMKNLPEPAKALLRMRYIEQTQAAELADQLSLTTNAVHQRLKRIRKALSDCIEQRLAKEGIHG